MTKARTMNRFRAIGLSFGLGLALSSTLPTPAPAAVPTDLRITAVLTPAHKIDTRYRNGDDGSASIPLGWGSCSDITNKESGGGFSVNIATYCGLIEPSAGAATVTASTLGAGWTMTGTGNRTLTLGTGVSSTSVTFTATYSGKTATKTIIVSSVASASADTTAPTYPMGCSSIADATGIVVSCDSAMDPHVSGQNETGLKDYQIFRDGSGSALATVAAASVGSSFSFTGAELGGSTGGAVTQTANNYSFTSDGSGIGGTAEEGYTACGSVSGDFNFSTDLHGMTGGDASNAQAGLMLRDPTTFTGGELMTFDRINRAGTIRGRYRATSGVASTTVGTTITQAAPGFLRTSRAGSTLTLSYSADGNIWSVLGNPSVALPNTIKACLFGGDGGTSGPLVADFRNVTLQSAGRMSYHDAVTDGASHSYVIKARDNAGTPNVSAASAAVSATAPSGPDTTAPSAPTGNACSGTSSTTISCSWTACTDPSGIRSYVPWVSTTQFGTYANQPEQTATTFGISGLSASTTRWVYEQCIDNAGNTSGINAAVSGTTLSAPPTDTTAPTVPSGNSASGLSTTVIRVNSSGSTDTQSGILDYRLYVANASGGPFALGKTCASFPCDYTVGSSNTTRYFQLTARDGAATPNESAPSATFIGATLASASCPSFTYCDGFESGTVQSSLWTLSDNGHAVHTFVSTPAAPEGVLSHKCVLTWSSTSDFRCELSANVQSNYTTSPFFTDWVFKFSTYIPSGEDSTHGRIIGQWHGYGGFAGTPDVNDTIAYPAMNIRADTNGSYKIECSTSPSQPTLETERVPCFPSASLGTITYNQWVNWQVEVVWDYRSQPTGNGLVKVWKNGALMLSKTHVSTGYNDFKQMYFKMGEYMSGLKFTPSPTPGSTYTIYHDDYSLRPGP